MIRPAPEELSASSKLIVPDRVPVAKLGSLLKTSSIRTSGNNLKSIAPTCSDPPIYNLMSPVDESAATVIFVAFFG